MAIKRASVYYPLKWRVDCKPAGQVFFEVICAFNVDSVAIAYAEDCAKGARHMRGEWAYRVMQRTNKGWVLLKEFS